MPARQPLRLWDVENAEAHVHASLNAGLSMLGARLDRDQELRAFAFLWLKCWELSGLEADAKTLRYVFEVHGFTVPRSPLEPYEPIRLPQFSTEAAAGAALEAVRWERVVAFASIDEVRPRGAYDPARGLSFSTYSFRLLTVRVTDWYRSDPDFGDTRYSRGRRHESLEALGERFRGDGEGDDSFIDRHGPGSRLEFVDELNPQAYEDSIEEALTRETLGR